MLRTQLIIVLFSLAFASVSFAQSTRVVEVNDDGATLYLKYVDDELTVLKIDGKTIPQTQYKEHQELLSRYEAKEETKAERIKREVKERKETYDRQYAYDKEHDVSRDSSDDLAKAYEDLLEKEDLFFDKKSYDLRLSKEKLRLNGNTMPSSLRERLADLAYDIIELDESDDYTIKIKIKKGSRSISVRKEE